MGDLTLNFDRSEFACKCGCGLDGIDMDTVRALQQIRSTIDKPIIINSGCRCEQHNITVIGSPNSRHLLKNRCTAADITAGINLLDLFLIAGTHFTEHGMGLYPEKNFIHVDLGPMRKWIL